MTDKTSQHAAYNEYEALNGPSFMNGVPDVESWLAYKNKVKGDKVSGMMDLWFEKAKAADGIPLRSDLKFEEMARFGSHITMYKLDETGKWMTTFCGTAVVQSYGMELTGKYLEDYADQNSYDFWLDNIKIMIDEAKPVTEFYSLSSIGKEFIYCVDVNLPLRSGDSEQPDMFMSVLTFGPDKESILK